MPLDYPEGFFDYVITADVLEHLVDPWRIVANIRPHLKETGKVLASIPNIMHVLSDGPHPPALLHADRNRWPVRRSGIWTRSYTATTVPLTNDDRLFVDSEELATTNTSDQFAAYQYLVRVIRETPSPSGTGQESQSSTEAAPLAVLGQDHLLDPADPGLELLPAVDQGSGRSSTRTRRSRTTPGSPRSLTTVSVCRPSRPSDWSSAASAAAAATEAQHRGRATSRPRPTPRPKCRGGHRRVTRAPSPGRTARAGEYLDVEGQDADGVGDEDRGPDEIVSPLPERGRRDRLFHGGGPLEDGVDFFERNRHT